MKLIYTIVAAILLAGCSATPKLDSVNGVKQGEVVQKGTISSVSYERKSSLIEDFGSFVVGDVIGEQFGGGNGKDILGIVGGTITSEIYEQKFADEYTKLNVRTAKGDYPVYIKGHLKLNVGDEVNISISDNKITGISLIDKK